VFSLNFMVKYWGQLVPNARNAAVFSLKLCAAVVLNAAIVTNETLYVMGGWDGTNRLSSVETLKMPFKCKEVIKTSITESFNTNLPAARLGVEGGGSICSKCMKYLCVFFETLGEIGGSTCSECEKCFCVFSETLGEIAEGLEEG